MNINNLHSLLNGRWFINESYGHSLLPLLSKVLNNKIEQPIEKKEFSHHLVFNNTTIEANTLSAENKEPFVAVIPIKNPIYKYNQGCGVYGTKHYQQVMERYANDSNCTGICLDIDSGGGQVSGTPEFYDFIKNYAKPVVAYTDGLMCSAAYYIGSSTSHIVANKRADAIGSIGVMISFIDMTGYYEKKGARVITEYATKSKSKNKSYRELLSGNPDEYIKNELDPITDVFHADMTSARPNLNKEVLEGATFNAEKSLSLGLIDEIGTLQTAINKVISLAKSNNTKNTNMAKLNVPTLEAILGKSFSQSENETGLLLTDEQATLVETALTENSQTKEDLTATEIKLTKALADSKVAIDKFDAAKKEVQTALETAEVEGATEMTTVEGINKLSALVTEYGNVDGGKLTNPIADVDESVDSPLQQKLQETLKQL